MVDAPAPICLAQLRQLRLAIALASFGAVVFMYNVLPAANCPVYTEPPALLFLSLPILIPYLTLSTGFRNNPPSSRSLGSALGAFLASSVMWRSLLEPRLVKYWMVACLFFLSQLILGVVAVMVICELKQRRWIDFAVGAIVYVVAFWAVSLMSLLSNAGCE